MAERRLMALERKFSKDPGLREQYTHIMGEYIRKGYVRRLNEAEAQQRGKRTWYLPHFGVRNVNKPEKLRVVFDAAAEVNGVSLNSVLLSGPDLGQPLATILMKFRQRLVGVCADVVEMFHQVQIRREDQEAQRFLWRIEPEAPLEDYVMTVMTFGATCSPCSAQFVKNKNAREFQTVFPEAAVAIIHNHYVDDYVHCFTTEEEAVRVTKEVLWVHKQGGFELKRFVSNCKQVSDVFNSGGNALTMVNLDRSADGQFQRVLGMVWDNVKDELKFALSFNKIDGRLMTGATRPTKREALRITMSVFDPFGLAAEYSIVAKLILKKVWQQKVGWDDGIPDEAFAMWRKWLNMLKDIETLRMPRCYDGNFFKSSVELHVFADASESAYGAVAYWRISSGCGIIRLAFVMGKAKCAPLKLTTVPRLELQAAVLATRLRTAVLQNHDLTPVKTIMWSDSKTTLAWITSDHRRYKPYVAH
ncbi:uncharacterized protein [Eurosta solidaginis]|uniref:uncharacterized protein isoform X1 n=1 Tax=Eurosta solidaginis TaxID=178769 RepID=UPI0035308A05